jgi:hypothetical protein
VFHNRDFQQRVIGNPALWAKYDFLQQNIFWDLFADTAYEKSTVPKTFWDVTKIILKTDRLDDVFAGLFQVFRSI